MFCQNWGKKNNDSAKFCYNCGSSLKIIKEENNLTAFSEKDDNSENNPLLVTFPEIRKNFSKFKSLAEDGDVYAMAVLGHYYSSGKEKNIEMAVRYYKRAAATYPILYNRLGRIYDHKKEVRDKDLALDYYKKGVVLNDPEAMISLGRCYRYGRVYDLNVDYDKVMELYKRAARLNSLHAMCEIAECYLEGEIVDQNDEIAFDWYNKAIETPSKDNCYKSNAYIGLGKMYLDGNSFVSSNLKKAFNYFLQAKRIDEYNDEAKWRVGYCYLEGIGVNNDDDKAFECFESCIQDGYIFSDEAKYYLGYCYYYGRGVDEDEEYGLELIRDSAFIGYEEAINWCDENGIDYEDID